MNKKYTIQLVIALVILAGVLIFLGVNFVPRIYASSLTQNNLVIAGQPTRSDYLDERYPRAILDLQNSNVLTSTRSYLDADWIIHNPTHYTDGDSIVRNPSYYDDTSFRAYPHQ